MSNEEVSIDDVIESVDGESSKKTSGNRKAKKPTTSSRRNNGRNSNRRNRNNNDYLRIPFVGRLKSVIILALGQFGVFTAYVLFTIMSWQKVVTAAVIGADLPEKLRLLPEPHLSVTLISASLFVFGLGMLFFVDSEDYDPDE